MMLLIVDDNPADVGLAREALANSSIVSEITTCKDGEEALAFLHKDGGYANTARPDLMILDLSLPGRDGLSVLTEVKADPELKRIPVVIFSTSRLAKDIARSYQLGANCYISKPGNLKDFFSAIRSIQQFWFAVVSLPAQGE
jgi:chemotaxis family two-component system response regulator Rcp1